MGDTHASGPGGDERTEHERDDLQLIVGIGRVVEARLQRAGVRTYNDLAATTPEKLAAILAGVPRMSAETIARQDWIGQARERLGEAVGSDEIPGGDEDNGQRYQTFTVELLIDHDDVRRTQVRHVQSGDQRQWTGLATKDLIEYLTARATAPETGEPEGPPDPDQSQPTAASPARPDEKQSPAARLRLLGLTVVDPANPHVGSVPAGTSFVVRLSVDLESVGGEGPFQLSAVAQAKRLGGSVTPLGEATATVSGSGPTTIELDSEGIPAGTYRLDAVARLLDSEGRPRAVEGLVEDVIFTVA